MQHRGSESKSFTATEDESFRSEFSEAGSPLLDSVAKGKDAVSRNEPLCRCFDTARDKQCAYSTRRCWLTRGILPTIRTSIVEAR
jgi:hypothetical protein